MLQVDPNCPKCDEVPHTIEHWLDCPGTLQAQMEIFSTTEPPPVYTVSTRPRKSVVLARRTLCQLGVNAISNKNNNSSCYKLCVCVVVFVLQGHVYVVSVCLCLYYRAMFTLCLCGCVYTTGPCLRCVCVVVFILQGHVYKLSDGCWTDSAMRPCYSGDGVCRAV